MNKFLWGTLYVVGFQNAYIAAGEDFKVSGRICTPKLIDDNTLIHISTVSLRFGFSKAAATRSFNSRKTYNRGGRG